MNVQYRLRVTFLITAKLSRIFVQTFRFNLDYILEIVYGSNCTMDCFERLIFTRNFVVTNGQLVSFTFPLVCSTAVTD